MPKQLTYIERHNKITFQSTVEKYFEAKASMGDRKDRVRFDLGYSADRIIRSCKVDFVVDVEKAIRRALKISSALDRLYVLESFTGNDMLDSRLFKITTADEYQKIELSAQKLLAEEFRSSGLYPHEAYFKPVDIR